MTAKAATIDGTQHPATVMDLAVHGITCETCASTITTGLLGVPRVDQVEVDIKKGRIIVTGTPAVLDEAEVRERLVALGFEVDPDVAAVLARRRWIALRSA